MDKLMRDRIVVGAVIALLSGTGVIKLDMIGHYVNESEKVSETNYVTNKQRIGHNRDRICDLEIKIRELEEKLGE